MKIAVGDTAVVEAVGPLVSLLLVIAVLLLIIRQVSPFTGRRSARRVGLMSLARYDADKFVLGPLLITMFFLSEALGGGDGASGLFLVMGICLGVLSQSTILWQPVLFVTAVAGLVLQFTKVVLFVAQPEEGGVLAVLFKTSALLLFVACFLLGAMLSLVWSRRLTTKALTCAVVLEVLMLFAQPAFEVATANPLYVVIKWGLLSAVLAVLLGLFSFPITLDLLAVGLGVALWSSAAGDDYFPVLIGTVAALTTRTLSGGLRRRLIS